MDLLQFGSPHVGETTIKNGPSLRLSGSEPWRVGVVKSSRDFPLPAVSFDCHVICLTFGGS